MEDPEATSVETQAHTREIPGTLRLENATSTSLNLRWNTLPGAENGFPYVQRIQVSIQYRQVLNRFCLEKTKNICRVQ